MIQRAFTKRARLLILMALATVVGLCLLPAYNKKQVAEPKTAVPHERSSTKKIEKGDQGELLRKPPTPETSGIIEVETKFPEASIERENATFFSLVRNSDQYGILRSIRSVEDRFNNRYHYDWVFANDKPFTENFIKSVSKFTSGRARFVQIPKEMWSLPDFIDPERAKRTRRTMRRKRVKYGFSESYRHMCRFNSGFFYDLPVMKEYRYFWRVEPDVDFRCDILYDPFTVLRENDKVYGFNMAPLELHTTVETLWHHVQEYQKFYPDRVATDNNMAFLTDDDGRSFNMCHFWSNFEIADLEFFRSDKYRHFFQHLDQAGGIYYERWGDAPIHTMAVSLLLNKDQLQFFGSTGYYHEPNQDCPRSFDVRLQNNCDCAPREDFTWGPRSCIPKFFDIHSYDRPAGASKLKYRPIHKSEAYKKEAEEQAAAEAAAEAEKEAEKEHEGEGDSGDTADSGEEADTLPKAGELLQSDNNS